MAPTHQDQQRNRNSSVGRKDSPGIANLWCDDENTGLSLEKATYQVTCVDEILPRACANSGISMRPQMQFQQSWSGKCIIKTQNEHAKAKRNYMGETAPRVASPLPLTEANIESRVPIVAGKNTWQQQHENNDTVASLRSRNPTKQKHVRVESEESKAKFH